MHERAFERKGTRFPTIVPITALRDQHRKAIGYLPSRDDSRTQDEFERRCDVPSGCSAGDAR